MNALLALLVLALGVLCVLYPYTFGHEMPGDLVDSRFNLSVLEFFYRTVRAVVHGQTSHFLSAPFFYPWPRVTNFSDTFWGDAEIYAIFRAFGLGALTSYRAWFVAGFVLTYIATFISMRKFGLGAWGAAAGAFLFTFPLPMAAQFNHTQLVYRLWAPPALLACHDCLSRQNLRAGSWSLLFVALQLAASIYLGLFLILLLVSYAIALCVVGGIYSPLRWAAVRVPSTSEVMIAAILLAATLTVVAIIGIPYFDVQSTYGMARRWQDVAVMLPRPGSYLLAGASMVWPNLSSTFAYSFEWEHQLFPGLSALIACAWFLLSKNARIRQPLAAPMLVSAAILVLITIDVGGHRIYPLIYLLPGFSALRAVSRIILVIMLPLAVLFGALIDNLASARANSRLRLLLAVALSLFAVVECSTIYYYESPPSDWRDRFNMLRSKLPHNLPADAVLAIASPAHANARRVFLEQMRQTDADLAAVMLGVHTLNGYSGNVPPGWKPMTKCSDVGENLRSGRHFLVEHHLPVPDFAADQFVLVGFGTCDPIAFSRDPTLQLARTYNFTHGSEGNNFVSDGFSTEVGDGRLTDATNAFLFFSLSASPPGLISLEIEARSASASPTHTQHVAVLANGEVCGRLTLTASRSRTDLACPAGSLRNGNNSIQLRLAHSFPAIPAVTGPASQLGVRLMALAVTPHS